MFVYVYIPGSPQPACRQYPPRVLSGSICSRKGKGGEVRRRTGLGRLWARALPFCACYVVVFPGELLQSGLVVIAVMIFRMNAIAHASLCNIMVATLGSILAHVIVWRSWQS